MVSSDSGGSIFVQPDVADAPFTPSYQGWLSSKTRFFSRAEVSPAGSMFGVEWSELPVTGRPANVTFSPDGRHMAWSDADGLKVAGVPNLDAGTDTCTLSSPPVLISATARMPSFGGGDVAAILEARKPPVQDGRGQLPGDSGQSPGDSAQTPPGGGQGAGAAPPVIGAVPAATGGAIAAGAPTGTSLSSGSARLPAKLEIRRARVDGDAWTSTRRSRARRVGPCG